MKADSISDASLPRRRAFFWLRLSLLLILAAGALTLVIWSRKADPRFFQFLQSPPGRAYARVMRWDRWMVLPGVDRPLNEAENLVKSQLEAEIAAEQPAHRIELKNGVLLSGRILEELPDRVVFQEAYGDSGQVSIGLRRTRIRRIEAITGEPPSITPRDVRFRMEFPDLAFFRRVPYSVMTDESYFEVEDAVKTLRQLHQEFMQAFGPLIRLPEREDHIQVVFFSDEERYQNLQGRYAPYMEHSAGFYSPLMDRLYFFNQKSARSFQEAGDRLRAQGQQYLRKAGHYGGEDRVNDWVKSKERSLLQAAEAETLRTIRHEGAHQLFYNYGIHSDIHLENTWLVEGLAVYCETERFGGSDSSKGNVLKKALSRGRLMSLDQLVRSRDSGGFFYLHDPEDIEMAYLQSWSLVRMLMQQVYRSAFFAYIESIRNPQSVASLMRADRYELLVQQLSSASSIPLTEAYRNFLEKM